MGKIVEIYIRLMDEGIEVFRPAQALDLGKGAYKILAEQAYNPESETWEFLPGTVVRGEIVNDDEGGQFLMAAEAIKTGAE